VLLREGEKREERRERGEDATRTPLPLKHSSSPSCWLDRGDERKDGEDGCG